MAKFGLSFSGGGVRSAAFCSGVLRRLLQKEVRIDYLSCVSGGGYTGSAYVDWKYRHDKKDDKKWHQKFFNHMRENVGLVCSFQNPCQGIFDCVIFCALAFIHLCHRAFHNLGIIRTSAGLYYRLPLWENFEGWQSSVSRRGQVESKHNPRRLPAES